MKTLTEILEGLQKSIPAEAIHAPDSSAGIFGEYVTAQWAMQEANNIFGVDGIYDIDVMDERMIEIPVPGHTFGNYVFITTVKIALTYLDGEGQRFFYRIGRGVGTAFAPYNRDTNEPSPVKPQQLDTAAKSALSDAIKNALMRTGQRLGAELYFDERMAQVLGWEVETDRVTGRSEGGGGENDLESLGAVKCKYGFGQADEEGVKPYTGWTIQQMWDDPGGRGVFDWAVEKEATGYFNERLRKYAALKAEEEPEESEEPDPDARMITIWTGKEKIATDKPDWSALCGNEAFNKMLKDAFDPDDKMTHFNPNHKRMTNHYNYHFGVPTGKDLTWEMLNALVARCKDGEEAAAFGYPDWYGEKDDDEVEPTTLDEMVHDTPAFILGKGKKTQQVPTGLQPVAKEAGIEDPKAWLWEIVMEKEPVGEWTPAHTDLVCRIIDTIANTEGIEHDSPVVGQMWTFGANGIVDQ